MLGRVVKFKARGESLRFGGSKGFIERSGPVRVQVVQNDHNFLSVGVVRFGYVIS